MAGATPDDTIFKVLKDLKSFFLDFSVQRRPDTIPNPGGTSYTILSVTPFSINYNKTHK